MAWLNSVVRKWRVAMARHRNEARGEGWNISFVCGPTPNPKLCEIGSRFSSVEEGKTPSLPHPFLHSTLLSPCVVSLSNTRSFTSTLLKVIYFYWWRLKFYFSTFISCGPGSSVGIEIDYGLDVSRSNPGGDEIFRPSRPALGPVQPPVKWVPGVSRGWSAVGACCWPLTSF